MICKECKLDKTKEEMQTTLGRNGKVYLRTICKRCYTTKTILKNRANRKIIGSAAWHRRRYDRKKTLAAKRKIEFDLTPSEYRVIMSATNCFYCDETPKIKSIDRFNNAIGYTATNCVMACLTCNKLKSSFLSKDKDRLLKIMNKL